MNVIQLSSNSKYRNNTVSLISQHLHDGLLHLRNRVRPHAGTFLGLLPADQTFAIAGPGEFYSVHSDHVDIKQAPERVPVFYL